MAVPNAEVKIMDPVTWLGDTEGRTRRALHPRLHVMKGYYKMPERHQTGDKDGWLRSEIWASWTRTAMAITGRCKDMIIRGGENIYPSEIEEFLYRHPKDPDVQVVGAPSEKYGEEVALS